MKEGIIPILVLLSVLLATAMFNNKINSQKDDVDKMEQALKGAKAILPAGTNISFRNIPVKNEQQFWARYTLAPCYMAFTKHNFDTVLTICQRQLGDSVNNDLTRQQHTTLWSNKDDQYCYYLTTKPRTDGTK